ncbi:unnamed protein product [Ilex paraguariensis]|uniref:Late embryogenesis abundant protein LEA-2 subgroup domain-containing protein n=1 Tax=Ilex paraguariensis TaxID=185542 RepID=A0ABC8UHY2_9AQUA
MSEKECIHHKEKRQKRIRAFCACLLIFISIVLFVILIVWAVLQPKKPRFVLQDATVNNLNVSAPNILSSNIQVTIVSRNPNENIGIYYDKLTVYATYRSQQITYTVGIQSVYQGHKDTNVWSPFIYGDMIPIAPYNGPALSQEQASGGIRLMIKIDGRVRFKVGSITTGRYNLHVRCPAYIPFGKNINEFPNTGIVVGNSFKYQLAQSCRLAFSKPTPSLLFPTNHSVLTTQNLSHDRKPPPPPPPPQPNMSEKTCTHHHKEKRQKRIRRCCACLLIFNFILLVVILIVWTILQPKKPRFVLQDATVNSLNISAPNILSSNIQVTIVSRNPNDNIRIYYDRLTVYATNRSQQITYVVGIQSVYQGHKDTNVWSPFIYGDMVPIAPYNGPALSQEQASGGIRLLVKIDGRVRFKVGRVTTGRYNLHVRCPTYIPFGKNINDFPNTGIVVGNSFKYQLAQSCHVSV